jgi:CRISPR-associated protein Csx17
MNAQLLHLTGCAPVPLAKYLKGLGILRVVAEQADPEVRGWWQDEHFCLLTKLTADDLEEFFLRQYGPTPFVSPWNRGSGFYADADPVLLALASSTAPRFAAFRTAITDAREQLGAMREAERRVRDLKGREKAGGQGASRPRRAAAGQEPGSDAAAKLAEAERQFKALKANLYGPCRAKWRGPHRRWLDAAVVVLEGSQVVWPALLGTGGNDGRLDFTYNAMQRLQQLFDLGSPEGAPRPATADLLCHALWSTTTAGLVAGAAIGQFLPGSAGGANSTTASDGPSLMNPWDLVLALEGAVLFSGRATRRLDPAAAGVASAPFAVRADGTASATRGAENSKRGEQWMPIWGRPTTSPELEVTIGEARLQLGRSVAFRPIDAAAALGRLGVARGISAFTRFGYLERNGQSTLAVPIGRVEVRERPRGRLVDDISVWIDRLQSETRKDQGAPARFETAQARLSDAAFAALTHDDEPARWQEVLVSAARVEAVQAAGTGFGAGPIPPLSRGWLAAADDGSPEWRLACALGSAAAGYDRAGRPVDPVRRHWLPLAPGGRRFDISDRALAKKWDVVASGRDLVSDLGAVVLRRLVEADTSERQRLSGPAAGGTNMRGLPLAAAAGFEAAPRDIADFLAGRLDLERLHLLARALMAVRWRETAATREAADDSARCLEEGWLAIRLACLP